MVMKKKQVGAMKRGGEAIMKARGGKMIEAILVCADCGSDDLMFQALLCLY